MIAWSLQSPAHIAYHQLFPLTFLQVGDPLV